MPPSTSLRPTTSSNPSNTEPVTSACMTENWPWRSRLSRMKISVTVPKVAVSNAPTLGPVYNANWSTASLNSAASGIIPKNDSTKTSDGLTPSNAAPIAAGTRTRSQ